MNYKVCSNCNKILAATTDNFYKKERGKYGVAAECKECSSLRKKKRYQKNKEQILKKAKVYYQDNKEEIKERVQEYKKNNSDKVKETNKNYRLKHPENAFNGSAKRRHKEKELGNGITQEQWLECMEYFNWTCAYSGISLSHNNKSLDHIVSLYEEGVNEIWNCVPMDKILNSSKNNKDMISWYQQQEFYSEERLQKIYKWQNYAKEKWDI